MAGEGEIVVNEEAREIMLDLGRNNPGAPSSVAITHATGAKMSQGSTRYHAGMRTFGKAAHARFQMLMELVKQDCASAIEAIDDLHRQDQEIMRLLTSYETETQDAIDAGNRSSVAFTKTKEPHIAPQSESGDTNW